MSIFEVKGMFPEQRGLLKEHSITGYNSVGEPFRKYTWIRCENEKLNGKSFESLERFVRANKI